jgi:hypothetical protein
MKVIRATDTYREKMRAAANKRWHGGAKCLA